MSSDLPSRAELLAMSDATLLNACHLQTWRATGPGGQHRNTTETGVRLTLKWHPEITVYAANHRSQHINRCEAINKMRKQLVLLLREDYQDPWTGPWELGKKDVRYLPMMAILLDAFAKSHYRLADTAKNLGINSAKLLRIIHEDLLIWRFINENRQQKKMKPLTY